MPRSSTVEQLAVNESVPGSNPGEAAQQAKVIQLEHVGYGEAFFCFWQCSQEVDETVRHKQRRRPI